MDSPRLCYLISASGVPERELRHSLRVSRRTWSDWMWGKAEPSAGQRERLAELLHCPVEALNKAFAHQREEWSRYLEERPLAMTSPENEERKKREAWAEIIVSILASAVTALIVTLMTSGSL